MTREDSARRAALKVYERAIADGEDQEVAVRRAVAAYRLSSPAASVYEIRTHLAEALAKDV